MANTQTQKSASPSSYCNRRTPQITMKVFVSPSSIQSKSLSYIFHSKKTKKAEWLNDSNSDVRDHFSDFLKILSKLTTLTQQKNSIHGSFFVVF